MTHDYEAALEYFESFAHTLGSTDKEYTHRAAIRNALRLLQQNQKDGVALCRWCHVMNIWTPDLRAAQITGDENAG